MEMRLDDKVAIVTGAGGGFGVAYSRALAESGARVVLADVNLEAATSAAKDLEGEGHDCIAVGADVASEESAAEMAAAAIDRFGGIDILVNNAGLMSEIPFGQPLSELSIDFWDKVMRINLTGPLICIQAVLPSMKERGSGKILVTSATASPPPAAVVVGGGSGRCSVVPWWILGSPHQQCRARGPRPGPRSPRTAAHLRHRISTR